MGSEHVRSETDELINRRLTQTQWIGIVGALVTLIAMFAPLYDFITLKITLVSLGWPAIAVGVAAVVAVIAIVRREGTWSLIAGLVALGVSLYVLIINEVHKPSAQDQLYPGGTHDKTGDVFAHGLNEMADAALAPQWGWALLAIGVGAILFSSWALIRSDRASSRASTPDD